MGDNIVYMLKVGSIFGDGSITFASLEYGIIRKKALEAIKRNQDHIKENVVWIEKKTDCWTDGGINMIMIDKMELIWQKKKYLKKLKNGK